MNETKVYSAEEIEEKILQCPFCKKTYLEICKISEQEPIDLTDIEFSPYEFCVGEKCSYWKIINSNGGYCGRFEV